jgi:hypothetical protein
LCLGVGGGWVVGCGGEWRRGQLPFRIGCEVVAVSGAAAALSGRLWWVAIGGGVDGGCGMDGGCGGSDVVGDAALCS